MACAGYDNNARQLTNIADIYGLHQLIAEPTRITENSATLIDLIYTCPVRVVCSGVAHIAITDHGLVYVYRKLSIELPKNRNSITYRSFKDFNSSDFPNDIRNTDWDGLSFVQDPNLLWTNWKSNFYMLLINMLLFALSVLDPKKSLWITIDLKKRMHERDVMKIRAMKSNNSLDWANFKRIRNKVSSNFKSAKELFYNNRFYESNSDPRKIWQVVNELMSRKSGISSIKEIILDNDTSTTNSSDLSEAFNHHFSQVGPRLASNITCFR